MNFLDENVARLDQLLSAFDECRIAFYDGARLVVIGDFDSTYHHNFEAEFIEVSYVACPIDFRAQRFRVLNAAEIVRENLANYLENGYRVFCFQDGDDRFFIAARELVLREKLVLHRES